MGIVLVGCLATPVIAFLVGAWFTGSLRSYALRVALLDVPNERSSHRVPTPRGGGAGIPVLAVGLAAAAAVAEAWSRGGDAAIPAGIGVAVGAIAILGWLDDHRNIKAVVRLVVQFLIAGLAVAWLGPLNHVSIGGFAIPLGFLGWPLTMVWFVWMANLYNFMDGIDGIAGTECLMICITAALWFAAFGAGDLMLVCLGVAGAAGGFLVFNWAPAKIFMGDVGSLAVGLLIGIVAVVGQNRYGIPLLAFVILAGVFIGDATLTLARRIARRERIFSAHREHYYQRAVKAGTSHGAVVLIMAGANLALALFASMIVFGVGNEWVWTAAAAAVLAVAVGFVLNTERRALGAAAESIR